MQSARSKVLVQREGWRWELSDWEQSAGYLVGIPGKAMLLVRALLSKPAVRVSKLAVHTSEGSEQEA